MKEMTNKSRVWSVCVFCAWASCAMADDADTSWEHAPPKYVTPPGMVRGGAFIDRILPMPVGPRGLSSNTWGGDNVKPRNVENGLEDPQWSYWCMNVHRDATDGKEHMFAVRWPERTPEGHMFWPNSHIVHAVADNPCGPFKVKQEIGPGHNVQWYQAKDGTHVLYANGRAYTAPSLDGPWKDYNLEYDSRGTPSGEMTNHTFTRREDGSMLMVSRGGRVWISRDGLAPFRKITNESAYPRIEGAFEDPVVWRDEVQYHLVVNDWFGRVAYYLRSKDGVTWVWDQGKAYDVDIARHPDGTRERWFKFERPNVRQDQFGRATHIYFAVIDSRKDLDKGSDNHSSKIIALPLTVQKRLQILNKEPLSAATQEIRVLIKAEPGFDPATDIDIPSLRFGAPSAVDFGKGGSVRTVSKAGSDMILTFDAAAGVFSSADFVGKLLGATRKGDLLFGYARLPGVSFIEPIIGALAPTFTAKGVRLRVENFGQKASAPGTATVSVLHADGTRRTTKAVVPAIRPYDGTNVVVPVVFTAQAAGKASIAEIAIACGGRSVTMSASFVLLSPGTGGAVPLRLDTTCAEHCGWGASRQDKNISDKELAVGTQHFTHGIGTHAPSRQEWLLDGTFARLSLQAGVVAGMNGTITVEVWGDGKRLYQSPLLKGGAEPVSIAVPVKGIRHLSLVTTDGGDGNSEDHVVYGTPRLERLPGNNQPTNACLQ